MRYLVYNGSPRGKKGNSENILRLFLEGLESAADGQAEAFHLDQPSSHADAAAAIASADGAVLVFPLYTDAMPGIVMAFLEQLEPSVHSLSSVSLGFIVHSGFPEAAHSRAVEQYLVRLTDSLGARYAGTAVLGGTGMTEDRRETIRALGRGFARTRLFDPALLSQLNRHEHFGKGTLLILRPLVNLGIFNRYFNRQLKANRAFGHRFDKPYGE